MQGCSEGAEVAGSGWQQQAEPQNRAVHPSPLLPVPRPGHSSTSQLGSSSGGMARTHLRAAALGREVSG